MNICHFSYSFFPLLGGMEAFIDNLARCQLEEDMMPTVFTPYVRKKDNNLNLPYEVSRFSRPSSKHIGLEQLLLPLAMLHKRKQFDLIHCHDAFPCGYIGYLFSRITDLPYVITSHGGDIVETAPGIVRNRSQTRKIKRAYTHAGALVAISSDMKAKMLALGAPAETLSLIHNGVHTGEFTPDHSYEQRQASQTPYLVYLGRLVESKGVDILLRAFADVVKECRDITLKIAGGGKAESDLKSLCHELGLDDHVEFLGIVRGEAKVELLQHALACVSATLKEAFGIVNIEALAAGTPVIASRVGGIPDIIEDGVNGVLVPPGDTQAFGRAIIEFLKHPSQAHQLATHTLKSVKPFDWQDICRQYTDIYSQILSEQ